VSTGRTDLVTNQTLRREISGFYLAMDLYSGFHLEWMEFVMPYRREISTVISPRLQLAIAQFFIDDRPIPDDLIPTRSELLQAIRGRPNLGDVIGEVLTTNWAGAIPCRRRP